MARWLAASIVVLLALTLMNEQADAQTCSFSITPDFGPTTIDIIPGPGAAANATFRANCTIQAGQTRIGYCAWLIPTADQISSTPFQFYMTAPPDARLKFAVQNLNGNQRSVKRDGAGTSTTPTSGGICVGGTGGPCTITQTYQFKYEPRDLQDRVQAGTYSTTSTLHIVYGTPPNNDANAYCATEPAGGISTTMTFTATAEVLPNCQLENMTNIDFGIQGGVTVAKAALGGTQALNGKFNVRCTYRLPYSIAIDDGQHASSGMRRMASGTNFIPYELRQPSCGAAWNAGSPLSGMGTTVNATNPYTVCARVASPLASAPPPGTYTDTVVVTVTF